MLDIWTEKVFASKQALGIAFEDAEYTRIRAIHRRW